MKLNPHVELAVRNAGCVSCKLSRQADGDDRCVTAVGNHRADILVVSKTPLGDKGLKEISTYLERAGIDVTKLAFTAALKCRVWDMEGKKTEQKACKAYLQRELDFIRPKWILTLGNEALFAATGKTGIIKYRGATLKATNVHGDDITVIPTIAPAMIYRNPGLKGGFEADLLYFHRLAMGLPDDPMNTPTKSIFVTTKDRLKDMLRHMQTATHCSYDLETSGFDEFRKNSLGDDPMIITAAFTLWSKEDMSDAVCYGVPLAHPRSPFRTIWTQVFGWIAKYLIKVKKTIAHNGKFDNRWLREFGCRVRLTFDTMLSAHLLNENRPKGLKPLAQQELGVKPWAMDVQGDGWYNTAKLRDTLWYNMLDTWHAARLYAYRLRVGLLEHPKLARLFLNITMPLSETLTDAERMGAWVDRPMLYERWEEAKAKLQTIDLELMMYVPEKKFWPKGIKEPNFNRSNFLLWLLFDELELPVIERGEQKEDGSPGDPSVSSDCLAQMWTESEHPIIPILQERSKWQKYESAFLAAYVELIDENDRLHTTFKIAGTTTGRTASGKADAEKVTGSKNIRGVNLQQVPRDSFIKGIFGAPDEWFWVEADYSQIELRIAAFLAQELTMLSYYNNGVDVHTQMAMRITGLARKLITSHHRTMAKSVNFGFLFGMGWMKYIETARKNYGVIVNEAEARAFRSAFFAEFPLLLKWHQKQRALARKYKRVESPLGRIRNLPDVDSPKDDVRAEAERQAINSPVQAMASDMALYAMTLIDQEFKRQGLRSHIIGGVHDSINLELWRPEIGIALPIVKNTMENLPLAEKFGVNLNVPIIADLKMGKRWGEAKELTNDQIHNWMDGYADAITV